jgi:hypothetical protein
VKLQRMHVEKEGKNGWSRWVRPIMAKYFMACCDCGLTHRMQFVAVKVSKRWKDGRWNADVLPSRTYRVMFRAKRAPSYTAKQRATRRHSCE